MAMAKGISIGVEEWAHGCMSPFDCEVLQAFCCKVANEPSIDRSEVLKSIPRNLSDSHVPFAALSFLLKTFSGPWPVFQLQKTYSEIWKLLPEEAKSGKGDAEAQDLLNQVELQCKRSYNSLLDLFAPWSASTMPAVIDPESGHSISHCDLVSCIRSFRLPLNTEVGQRKPTVAISLPNGPLLALSLLSTATYYTAAPIAHGGGVGAEQFRSDILLCKPNAVLALEADISRLGLRDPWIADAGILVVLVSWSRDVGLILRNLDGAPLSPADQEAIPNGADDTGLMLCTSGTTGTKKLVPLTTHTLVCGVAMVAQSWGLNESMRCLNQMPLNHVGGVVRNLLAPCLTGGSVICCSAFDANLFWDCVEDFAPTWYYATPSMHQGILEAGVNRPESLEKSRIRLVCNAGAALLPSLACQLRDTFSTGKANCIVLPSYGTTECMPISTPPLGYKLDKIGTSGVSVGPEVTALSGDDQVLTAGTVGRIAVRGQPVFGGYLRANHEIDRSCFTKNGWFDTGDMGYLDREGYLYITGRSKEVINRGGELISPFEIEETIVAASQLPETRIYGKIGGALAFSVAHDVLQEAVGIAIVTPPGAQRASLRDIQESVKSSLSSVKVPIAVVYMDAGLPLNNNKVLRLKLANRLGLPTLTDSTPLAHCHFEADSPPVNTPISEPLSCHSVQISLHSLEETCRSIVPFCSEFHIRKNASGMHPELFIAPKAGVSSQAGELFSSNNIMERLVEILPGYNLPQKVIYLEDSFPWCEDGNISDERLDEFLSSRNKGAPLTTMEQTICSAFCAILGVLEKDVSPQSDFFELGGTSMAAGQLLSKLRKEFQLRLAIDVLFANSTISALASLIADKLAKERGEESEKTPISDTQEQLLPGSEQTFSSGRPLLMLLQIVPMTILYPMRRALTWTAFMYFMVLTQPWPTNKTIYGRLFNIVLSIAVSRAVTRTLLPLIGLAVKWLMIGRYQEGLYPMWGPYHTRWWFVQKVLSITGLGVFNMFDSSRVFYYRLLGAKIGKKVTLHKGVQLGEYDLITIEDGAVLERCICRPFAAERNTSMYLGRIHIGANASIGLSSIVAAGTTIPANTCIGPNSSSWEIPDANEANRDLASNKIPSSNWLYGVLLGMPMVIVTSVIGAIPWLGCLAFLVRQAPKDSIGDSLERVIIWFSGGNRVGLHYAALVANRALGPIFTFVPVYLIKKAFDILSGPVRPGEASSMSEFAKFRVEILRKLMPGTRFHNLTELFGSHYEATSFFARAMGAKVGKRVYWPGTGPSIQDFSLLELGDDIVFGSRSHLVTSDGNGSDYIRIRSGAMVADRVVLLPGVELGQKTVMGSGALSRRNGYYEPGTIWVGSKGGDAVCLSGDRQKGLPIGHRLDEYKESTVAMPASYNTRRSSSITLVRQPDSETSSIAVARRQGSHGSLKKDADANKFDTPRQDSVATTVTMDKESEATESSTPFGRAFYQKKAPYRVWGQFTIFCYSTVITLVAATYWNAGIISAVQVVGGLFRSDHTLSYHFLHEGNWRPLTFYALLCALIVGITALQTIFVLAFMIAVKWIIIGRRMAGNFDWDKSSYCQRWQLYLKCEVFRRQCYGGEGILGFLTGTKWIVWYFQALGMQCGKDCALFANGQPSLMFTEPDLLTLGDRVTVDDASLVGHINTRGKFDLNPLSVGDRSVLRTGSRLLSGARMEADTALLEHTLVMAGDVVEAGTTAQGWPAEDFKGNRMPTMRRKQIWTAF
ncbi:hypothetical protein H072_23 [Dactylellina haptotyla CBS 200.50]|uniref:Carrier domain-containing protein n=1 Tax=Dactylellina haptotyla (strain CBS 200.50) TaxID=1284197 RepID=S8ASV0_DACHA|nr:hypothetical protein H072_23 [Dactylellina haptotyla CBS 200.50]